jgi:hypothetical protein
MEVLHSKKAQQGNSEIRKWIRNTHTPREREQCALCVLSRGATFIEEKTSTINVKYLCCVCIACRQ